MTAGNHTLEQAIAASLPTALRETVASWFERLGAVDGGAAGWLIAHPTKLKTLARLVAVSDFAGRAILRDWTWFRDAIGNGMFDDVPQDAGALLDELPPGDDEMAFRTALRRWRNRRLVWILWRCTARSADLAETLSSLSALADTVTAIDRLPPED